MPIMKFGDYQIEIVPDTEFRLDGGAMFGVVPRVLWEKNCPPDELNRIKMNMNCLFIETPEDRILIETGIGEKWTKREIEIHGIFRKNPFSQTLFEKTGYRPKDISIVVNTHLHFDHAGGNTILDVDGQAIPQFPNARYFVSGSELEHAKDPHERDRASYLPANWRPLEKSGQLVIQPDDYEVVDGLTMQTVRGHSETMQTVKLKRGGKTLYGFADLVPMTAHLSLPWIAGFDLFPRETLEAKRHLLKEAYDENWICLLYHDFETPLAAVASKDNRLLFEKIEE